VSCQNVIQSLHDNISNFLFGVGVQIHTFHAIIAQPAGGVVQLYQDVIHALLPIICSTHKLLLLYALIQLESDINHHHQYVPLYHQLVQ
jgi:hypothetical protein